MILRGNNEGTNRSKTIGVEKVDRKGDSGNAGGEKGTSGRRFDDPSE